MGNLVVNRRVVSFIQRWQEADAWGRRQMTLCYRISPPEVAALDQLAKNLAACGLNITPPRVPWLGNPLLGGRLPESYLAMLKAGIELEVDPWDLVVLIQGLDRCERQRLAWLLAGKSDKPSRRKMEPLIAAVRVALDSEGLSVRVSLDAAKKLAEDLGCNTDDVYYCVRKIKDRDRKVSAPPPG